jgi:hypothetical protein
MHGQPTTMKKQCASAYIFTPTKYSMVFSVIHPLQVSQKIVKVITPVGSHYFQFGNQNILGT